jgi:translation initiation factor 4G
MKATEVSTIEEKGKRRYDRDFLISLKDKKPARSFPDVLKAYTDILFSAENTSMMMMMNSNQMMSNKGSMQGNYDNYNKNKFGGSMGGDGGGSYGKGSMNKNKQKGSMNMNKMNKGSEGDRHQPPAVINLPEKIMLNTVENSYVIKQKTSQVELNEHEELLREVRNILNKLTPQNLQKLTGDLINLSINNEDRLKGLVEIIFEDSINSKIYTEIYANICKVRNLVF